MISELSHIPTDVGVVGAVVGEGIPSAENGLLDAYSAAVTAAVETASGAVVHIERPAARWSISRC